MIKDVKALLDVYCMDTTRDLERSIYKSTDCGAWIEFFPQGIRLGSIVEGCDHGTEVYTLVYPFTTHDVNDRINAIEVEADAIWKWANVPDANDETPAEQGLDFPDVAFDYQHLKI